nr:hypothetical protein [Streptomyces sp. adm13(2018)]
MQYVGDRREAGKEGSGDQCDVVACAPVGPQGLDCGRVKEIPAGLLGREPVAAGPVQLLLGSAAEVPVEGPVELGPGRPGGLPVEVFVARSREATRVLAGPLPVEGEEVGHALHVDERLVDVEEGDDGGGVVHGVLAASGSGRRQFVTVRLVEPG